MNKSTFLITVVGAFLVAMIVFLIMSFGEKGEERGNLVGVIMPGSVSEIGWNGIHYKGIRDAVHELGAQPLLIENAKEGSGLCAKAIDSLVRAGANIIILGSYNYPGEKDVEELIQKYPDVMFYCCGSFFKAPNYKVYFARVYQARYLSGIIAGLNTKNNRIGYVAAMNNHEVNRGLNAFTLGVRRVNPKAQVFVTWTGSWDDAEAESKNVDKLIDSAKVDLIAYHQNQDYVVKRSEARGVLSIGYNLEKSIYSPNVLTSVTTNWKMVYREFIQDYIQKKNSISNYWIGIEKDAVGLSFYSPLVSDSNKAAVIEAISQMKEGMDIFTGPIFDNGGEKRCGKDEILSDVVLRENMDWFVDGVRIYEE